MDDEGDALEAILFAADGPGTRDGFVEALGGEERLGTLVRRGCESLRVAGRVPEDHAGVFALAVGFGLCAWVL